MMDTVTAPQAQPGPFWRDRGLWLQLVIQSAVFFLFGAMDAGNAFSFGPVVPSWVLVAGYTLVFAGMLIQRWRAEVGLTVVAIGLVTAAGSLAGIYILAYLVVCYEAWFISAFVRRRRGMWLALLTGGRSPPWYWSASCRDPGGRGVPRRQLWILPEKRTLLRMLSS